MPTLESLRAIAARRTQGEWFNVSDGCGTDAIATNDYKEHSHESGQWICHGNGDPGFNSSSYIPKEESSNFRFIACAANTYDALLDVVEAAQTFSDSFLNEAAYEGAYKLSKALKRLESLSPGGEK